MIASCATDDTRRLNTSVIMSNLCKPSQYISPSNKWIDTYSCTAISTRSGFTPVEDPPDRPRNDILEQIRGN